MLAVAGFDQVTWRDPRTLERLHAKSERAFIESHMSPGQRKFSALRIDEDLNHMQIATELAYSSAKVAEQTWARICARARQISRDRGPKKLGRPQTQVASGAEPEAAPQETGAAVAASAGRSKRGTRTGSSKRPGAAGATALADLGTGNHTAIELRADAVAALAVAMRLPEAEFLELVARDAEAQRAGDKAAELTPYSDKDVGRMTTALTAAYQEAARELGDPAAGADLPIESPPG